MARPRASTTSRHPAELRRAELRERAVRLVVESREHHDSEWAAMKWAATKLGIGTPETVRLWVRQAPGYTDASAGRYFHQRAKL